MWDSTGLNASLPAGRDRNMSFCSFTGGLEFADAAILVVLVRLYPRTFHPPPPQLAEKLVLVRLTVVRLT